MNYEMQLFQQTGMDPSNSHVNNISHDVTNHIFLFGQVVFSYKCFNHFLIDFKHLPKYATDRI